jgi:hypothetical protein
MDILQRLREDYARFPQTLRYPAGQHSTSYP